MKLKQLVGTALICWCINDAMASSKTDHVPLNDIDYFLTNGDAPANASMKFPINLSSTILIVINPWNRTCDTAEVRILEEGIEYFYESIFRSQSEFDLKVRAVSIVDQNTHEVDAALNLESIIDVNFRPNPDDQELTNVEFHNIVLNLVNHFQSELVRYLKKGQSPFSGVEIIQARNPSNDFIGKESIVEGKSVSSINNNLIHIIGIVGSCVVLTALIFAGILYRRKLRPRKYQRPRKRNISPFRDGFQDEEQIEFPEIDILVTDDEDIDSYESSKSRFSFIPSRDNVDSSSGLDQDSAQESFMTSLREDFSSRLDSDLTPSKVLSADDIDEDRAELWAPAGKLGIAVDVVEGRPVVWRIKPGSPVEGFLQNGDFILGIDEVDTSNMSAADITSIMVRRMRQQRKITYVRPKK
eukprot:CAMPEP_0194208360 /NCGR_PEP_ID=MMETSP0156-20130528/6832_1 /TAXON_ID=33649 /ORGANISM="Thalassionema nitzschioides, Strain L26-B" /LENGTH=412 /DNA_ID=CAMNT_0038935311 /DNA_START=38 /DNA_END=1276 /DNA_ORIENTATION=-